MSTVEVKSDTDRGELMVDSSMYNHLEPPAIHPVTRSAVHANENRNENENATTISIYSSPASDRDILGTFQAEITVLE